MRPPTPVAEVSPGAADDTKTAGTGGARRDRAGAGPRCASPAAWIASTKSALPPRGARLQDWRVLRDKWKDVAGGNRLQHALYGLAAVELLKARLRKPRVTGGGLLPSHKDAKRVRSRTQAAIAAKRRSARRDSLQFTRTPDEDNCRYAITSPRADAANLQAGRKAADGFQYGRLAAHE
jgi:hypothetical protein